MPFLQPAQSTLAPASSPANTPRADAERQALRSFMSSMPGGSIDFSRTADRHHHKDKDALRAMSSPDRRGSAEHLAVDQSAVAPLQIYETSSKLHNQSTLSWQNRSAKPGMTTQTNAWAAAGTPSARRNRSPLRGMRSSVNNTTIGGITKRSSSAMGHSSSSKILGKSIHTADGACCGYRDLAEHQAAFKRCKGLFVTFCQNNVEQQLANAQRDLAVERESREGDADTHRHQLAALVHENMKLKKENDEMKEKMDKWDEVTDRKIAEINVLKEEYEKRWRDEVETNAKLRTSTHEAVEEAEKLKTEDGAKRYRIGELEAEVDNLKQVIKRTEEQAVDNAKRAQLLFDEKEVLAKKTKNFELELASLNETIRTKSSVILGLEKELNKANDKLSSISFFRENFQGKKKPGSAGLSRGVSMGPGSPMGNMAKKESLRQRYFGRMGRVE